MRRLLEATGQGTAARQVFEAVLGVDQADVPGRAEAVSTDMLAEMRTDEFTGFIVPST